MFITESLFGVYGIQYIVLMYVLLGYFSTLAPADFIAITQQLTISPGNITVNFTACYNISIEDDDIVESEEEFMVLLSNPANDPAVIINTDSSVVTIVEDVNDG